MPSNIDMPIQDIKEPTDVMPVSALVRSLADIVQSRFPVMWIRGEVSNFTLARSGHMYFVLKDDAAQLRCVMFRHRNQHLDWSPADGDRIDVRALLSVYEPRGEIQLNIEAIRRAGTGALYERFIRLRDSLENEGLFSPDIKRSIPPFPRVVGIVTSRGAAALRDIISTIKRRNPAVGIVLYPSSVQGVGAAREIAASLETAGQRAECDVMILARGGGSIEDLWCFNEEVVARAIRSCPIPVICGIGHETDVTIADLAADQRAATPTAAAEMASPEAAQLLRLVKERVDRCQRRLRSTLESAMQRLDGLARRIEHPRERLASQHEKVARLSNRLTSLCLERIESERWRLTAALLFMRGATPQTSALHDHIRNLAARLHSTAHSLLTAATGRATSLATSLEHLHPLNVLARGYSVVRDSNGAIVVDAKQLTSGELLEITLSRGQVAARVDSTK